MKTKRMLSALLLLALLLAISAPAALAEEEPGTLHIATLEDLQRLASNCRLDTYSEGLRVVLDNDIDLEGAAMSPIPTFGGSFDGGGHTIRNLRLTTDGSHQGLFRYIRETGEVTNLHLTGSVAPESGKCQIGALAGVNYGTVTGCSFNGSISGLNSVGGLVGENYGTVRDCTVSGQVDGKRFTGGVVGYNEGRIADCSNEAQVNTSISESALQLEDLTVSGLGNLELTRAQDEDVVSDSGGIVGYSKGAVLNCVNRGSVGYPHYGYNVGGVAGRQSGYLTACENDGEICGRKDVGGIVGQMEPYLLLKDSANLAEELALLNTMMNRASGTLGEMSQEMHDSLDGSGSGSSGGGWSQGGGTISHVDSAEETESENSGGSIAPAGGTISGGSGVTDEDIQSGLDYIDDNTSIDTDKVEVPEGFSDDLNGMFAIISDNTGELSQELTDVNNQFSRVMTLMANALNGAAGRQFFEDISDEVDEEDIEGRVSRNVNYGSVEGDRNVGGVIGDMGIEYEFDMEGSLSEVVGIEGIVMNTYETKCVSSDNVNQSVVTGKKDDIGGITGKQETGSILRCENYGAVSCPDGSYIGGVVGYSVGVVRQSYAMCDLSGTEYVGGIAGYGTTVTDCVSMVGMPDGIACSGAIAGWADMSGEEISGNLFVHETLGAVDGISYRGKAVPLPYEELLQRQELPAQFRTLRIQFLADGVSVAQVEFDYGGSLDPEQIPEVPEKEGYTGVWSSYNFGRLYHSAVIEAVYTPRQGALAAKPTREDSPMAIVLIEGDFDSDTIVNLHEFKGDDPIVESGRVLEKWVMQLSDLEEGQTYSLRFLPPEVERNHKVEIYIRTDGRWTRVETERAGSYLSFDCGTDTVVFSAVETAKVSPKLYIYAGAGAAALVGIGLTLGLARKKRHRAKAEAEEAATE